MGYVFVLLVTAWIIGMVYNWDKKAFRDGFWSIFRNKK